MAMRPRNTLVTVAPIKKTEQKQDNGIVIPQQTNQQYQECEVLRVGPGMLTHEQEKSPCEDLRAGQIVLVHVKQMRQLDAQHAQLQPLGVDFKTDDHRDMVLVDQSQIVAILQEPEEKQGLALTE